MLRVEAGWLGSGLEDTELHPRPFPKGKASRESAWYSRLVNQCSHPPLSQSLTTLSDSVWVIKGNQVLAFLHMEPDDRMNKI